MPNLLFPPLNCKNTKFGQLASIGKNMLPPPPPKVGIRTEETSKAPVVANLAKNGHGGPVGARGPRPSRSLVNCYLKLELYFNLNYYFLLFMNNDTYICRKWTLLSSVWDWDLLTTVQTTHSYCCTSMSMLTKCSLLFS